MSKINTEDFANFLLYHSEKDLSNLELQVLMNLISIDYEEKYMRKLFKDPLVNYKSYGFKISEDVYWKYRNYGANSIDRPEKNVELAIVKSKIKFIKDRLEFYNKNGYWDNIKVINKYYAKEREMEKLATKHATTFIQTVWLSIPIFILIALVKYIFS